MNTFQFHKSQGLSRLVEWLLAYQEEFCSMELVQRASLFSLIHFTINPLTSSTPRPDFPDYKKWSNNRVNIIKRPARGTLTHSGVNLFKLPEVLALWIYKFNPEEFQSPRPFRVQWEGIGGGEAMWGSIRLFHLNASHSATYHITTYQCLIRVMLLHEIYEVVIILWPILW